MGSDAVKNGLVDATGGVLEALRVARSMAAEAVGPGADPRTHVRVREYPPRKSPLQELMEEAEDVTGIERGERGERREERGEGNGSRGAMSGETEGEGTSRLGGALWAVGRALGVVAGVVSDVEDGEGFKMGLVGWAERGAAGLLGGLGRVAAAMGMHPFEKGEAHVLGGEWMGDGAHSFK